MPAFRRSVFRAVSLAASVLLLVLACMQPTAPSAAVSIELSLADGDGIRASSLPFDETALHVLVIREGTILPRSTGSAERQRLADALAIRARPRDALSDSMSFAERRAIIDGTRNSIALDGFLSGANYLVTVVAYNADDLDEEPYFAAARLTLEEGRNGVRLDLRRSTVAMLADFRGNYSIDPWSQEFAGLRLAVMDSGNQRALLLTGLSSRGWNEIEPFGDDYPDLDFIPQHIALADRGRLLMYGELSGQGDANGFGFLLTNSQGRILDWFPAGQVNDSIASPIRVDRTRGYAYFAAWQVPGVTQLNLATGDTDTFSDHDLPDPMAFTVSATGNLYIYTSDDGSNNRIERYNPIRPSEPNVVQVDESLMLGTNFFPADMTFVGNTLLMFDYTAVDGGVVVGLDSNYNIRGSFGSMYSDFGSLRAREFLGPVRFLDSNSTNVYIADGNGGEPASRIVRFRGATGLDWYTYGEFGGGVGQFEFVDMEPPLT